MKIDKEKNEVYLNDIEKIEFGVFQGIYELGIAFVIGCFIGLVLEIIKLMLGGR